MCADATTKHSARSLPCERLARDRGKSGKSTTRRSNPRSRAARQRAPESLGQRPRALDLSPGEWCILPAEMSEVIERTTNWIRVACLSGGLLVAVSAGQALRRTPPVRMAMRAPSKRKLRRLRRAPRSLAFSISAGPATMPKPPLSRSACHRRESGS